MRHGAGQRQLSRNSSHRRALLRNMATSLLQYERCETTVQKAKELRPVVEKLITLGRTDDLPSRRLAYGYILTKEVVHKLFADIGPRFASRNGGYTRIVRCGWRPGDAAEMAIIELVEGKSKATKTEASGKKGGAKKSAGATKKAAAPKAKAAKAGATDTKKKAKAAAK